MNEPMCDKCNDSGDECQACCEHEFDPGEGYTCLNCGKDGFEDCVVAAHDAAKDERKYR